MRGPMLQMGAGVLTSFICIWFAARTLTIRRMRSPSRLFVNARDAEVQADMPSPPMTCAWLYVHYAPSAWESDWQQNIQTYQDMVCAFSNRNETNVHEWARGLANTSTLASHTTFRNNCTSEVTTEAIEPLAGLLRHPYMCLKGGGFVVDKSYILVAPNIAIKLQPMPMYQPKAYYFDFGASLYTSGAGGASQSWVVDTYEQRGVRFESGGIYAWEAAKLDDNEVWGQIPTHLKPHYHWFNVPADPTPGSPNNCLEMLRNLTTVQDFVVLKIDIDNTPIEELFIAQLLASPTLLSLVDDFYFEHHVNTQPMHPYWGTQNAPQTLADSYKIFHSLRAAGILAHSWV